MRVASLQFESSEDLPRSRASIQALIEQAAESGADLMVLPEASQWPFGTTPESLATRPEPLDGPFVEWLVGQAAASGAVLTAGMFEHVDGVDHPFNTTVAVGPSGILSAYRKIHLYDALGFEESRGLSAGSTAEENLCVIEVGGVSIGLMTCFDLRFPEMARSLALKGAQVIVLGAAWVPGPQKVEQWRVLLRARAIESTSFVVAAAQPGERYCGHSSIVGPDGTLIAEAGRMGTETILGDLSVEIIGQVRAGMPVLAQRRLGIARPG